jgi:hypothetical protein
VLASDEGHFPVSGIPWPVRSPDLTVSDFFLWRCLKLCVYINLPHTARELKRAIQDEIATINQHLFRRVSDNFRNRLRQCVAYEGGHLQDVVHQN